MSTIKLKAFSGMLPATDDRLLPENAGAYARDCYLYSGRLTGWRQPKILYNLLNSTTRMAFRIPADSNASRISDTSYWLEFADVNTNVLRTPVVNDVYERYYFASPTVAPRYNTKVRIAASLSSWLLGVTTPTTAPGVAPAGGTSLAIAAARSYLYTWVTAYGEESAPSPALLQNGYVDDVWAITVTAPDSNDVGVNRNIATTRIYRTVTASDGTASFFLVTELPVATTSYNDTLSDTTVAQNIGLDTATWLPPPSDLQGIVAASNGMFVGWRANEVWFSVPFLPHTWPSDNTITTEYPIVGIGVVGQAIVVVTKGYPVVLTGASPDSLSQQVIRTPYSCSSRGSIVSAPDAVYYTSESGLIMVTPSGMVQNVTEHWITREKWKLLPLISNRAILHSGAYFSFGAVYVDPVTGADNATEAAVGFTIVSPQTASQEAPPVGGQITNPAFGWLSAPGALSINNTLVDHWTNVPLLIQSQAVYYYDYSDAAPTIMPYLWRSKIFQDQYRRGFEVMKVYFTIPSSTPTQNADRNTSSIQTLASDQYGIVRVYADDVLWTTREIRTSGELLRILSGGKFEFWQWELEGRVEILNVQAATSVKDLRSA